MTTTFIHPTAIIEKGAKIGDAVYIGPYAYIGACVTIGNRCKIHHHGTIEGYTKLGENNEVFPFAILGGKTHDLKYRGGVSGLVVGNNNVFREYVSVHCSTNNDKFTVLGDNNLILSYSHVAHDCEIGNYLIMSSHSALGGHVKVEDYVNIGWSVGVHQHCKLGQHCMLGACSKIVQSVLPYMLVDGNPAAVRTFNKVGLERFGFNKEELEKVRFIYKSFYKEGLNRSQAFDLLKKNAQPNDPIIGNFLRAAGSSPRGWL